MFREAYYIEFWCLYQNAGQFEHLSGNFCNKCDISNHKFRIMPFLATYVGTVERLKLTKSSKICSIVARLLGSLVYK